jgi:hypothetical protein
MNIKESVNAGLAEITKQEEALKYDKGLQLGGQKMINHLIRKYS